MASNFQQTQNRPRSKSFDKKTKDAQQQLEYELVCVGFGTTALPLAVALAERNPDAKMLFVEREAQFHWQPAHILPEKPVGSSYLRDLVTTQNPRSKFTFINFLHSTNQLIRFTNNSKTIPSRRLMGQYFRWAANNIAQLGCVAYGQEVVQVKPVKIGSQDQIAQWSIDMKHVKTQAKSSVRAKRVVFATGATPHIPSTLAGSPRVIHSWHSNKLLEKLFSVQPLYVAVVGADQEAAEVFEHLHTLRATKHSATMFYADATLRPEEDVPNVRDMLNRPESMPGNLPPEIRQRQQHRGSDSPRVNLHTLESLYEAQYTQKIHERDPNKWRFQMRASSEVVGVQTEQEKVRLVVRNPQTGETSTTNDRFDVVIAATGYTFAVDRDLVHVPSEALDGGAISVDREYRVNFRRDALAPGCGMWLLGSLEDRKERSDNFAYMAERAQRAARSITSDLAPKEKGQQQQQHDQRAMI